MKKLSENGRKLFIEWEGLEHKMYLDSGGKQTIGIGHLLTNPELTTGTIIINNKPVIYGEGLTDEQCGQLLENDVKRYEATVNSHVIVELNQNQFDALVSFCYNIGVAAFKTSTLLKKLNKGNYSAVTEEFKKWNKIDGKSVLGLTNRRKKEALLWGEPI